MSSKNVTWKPKLSTVEENKEPRMKPHQSRMNRYHPYQKDKLLSPAPQKPEGFFDLVEKFRKEHGLSSHAKFVEDKNVDDKK